MVKIYALGIISGIALSGCTSPQQKAMVACDGYGFTRGTAEYASCIETERSIDEQRRASLRAAGVQLLNQSQPQRPLTTQCVQHGIYVNCQTR